MDEAVARICQNMLSNGFWDEKDAFELFALTCGKELDFALKGGLLQVTDAKGREVHCGTYFSEERLKEVLSAVIDAGFARNVRADMLCQLSPAVFLSLAKVQQHDMDDLLKQWFGSSIPVRGKRGGSPLGAAKR